MTKRIAGARAHMSASKSDEFALIVITYFTTLNLRRALKDDIFFVFSFASYEAIYVYAHIAFVAYICCLCVNRIDKQRREKRQPNRLLIVSRIFCKFLIETNSPNVYEPN